MGILVRCLSCRQLNRVPKNGDPSKARCGSCGAALPSINPEKNNTATYKPRTHANKKQDGIIGNTKPNNAVAKKVTVASAWLRLFGIFLPFFAPYWMTEKIESVILFGGLWLAVLGPLFLLPDSDINNWEEDAKYMHGWFSVLASVIFRIFAASMALTMIGILLFGRGRM